MPKLAFDSINRNNGNHDDWCAQDLAADLQHLLNNLDAAEILHREGLNQITKTRAQLCLHMRALRQSASRPSRRRGERHAG